MDKVSTMGYGLGYIGGSTIPLVIFLVMNLMGVPMLTCLAFIFALTAVWWLVFSIPLLKNCQQTSGKPYEKGDVGRNIRGVGTTVLEILDNKTMLVYILAYFFYIDGVYTIIDMATAYGSALGLDPTGLLLALLVTQIVAFPFAILFGRLAQKYSSEKLIAVCIAAYFGIAVFAVFLRSQWQFWLLAVLVGMFQGGIQALSRSYFTRIIPPEQSGEYFGLMDICGKGAAFLGTTLVSAISQFSGSMSTGVGMIAVLFVIGFVLFRMAAKCEAPARD